MEQNEPKKKYESLTHGLGIAGLIIAILTLLVSFIPCFGVYAVFFGVLAIFISGFGLALAITNKHSKGLIIAALITAFIGCAIAYSQYVALDEATKGIQNKYSEQPENEEW